LCKTWPKINIINISYKYNYWLQDMVEMWDPIMTLVVTKKIKIYLNNMWFWMNECHGVHQIVTRWKFQYLLIFDASWWIFKKNCEENLQLMVVYILIYHYVVEFMHIWTIQLLKGIHFLFVIVLVQHCNYKNYYYYYFCCNGNWLMKICTYKKTTLYIYI
jgi:hypothetical protein